MRDNPRLQFTDAERADPELEKPIRKADKAADRADRAAAKIPKKTVKKKERVVPGSTTRSFFLTVFFGIFAAARSARSAALSALRMGLSLIHI